MTQDYEVESGIEVSKTITKIIDVPCYDSRNIDDEGCSD